MIANGAPQSNLYMDKNHEMKLKQVTLRKKMQGMNVVMRNKNFYLKHQLVENTEPTYDLTMSSPSPMIPYGANGSNQGPMPMAHMNRQSLIPLHMVETDREMANDYSKL